MHLAIVLAFLSLVLLPVTAVPARTLVFPHLLETSGGIGDGTAGGSDNTLHVTHAAALDGCGQAGPAAYDIFLYEDATGTPVSGASGSCDPCQRRTIDPTSPKDIVEVEALFAEVGATPQAGVRYSAVVRPVSAADEFVVVWQVSNVRSGPSDLAVFVFEPLPIKVTARQGGTSTQATTLHAGIPFDDRDAASVAGATDARLLLGYHGGRAGIQGSTGSSQVDVFLYDGSTGQLLVDGTGTPICAPCSFPLGTDAASGLDPFLEVDLEDLASAATFAQARSSRPTPIYMELRCVVSGDPELTSARVELRRGTISGGLDIQMRGPGEPIDCPGATSVPQLAPGLTLDAVPNPLNPSGDVRFTLARSVEFARLAIHDAQGRRVRLLHEGPLVAGPQAVRWDGRNDAGTVVASGTYHLRLDSPEGVARGKVTLLK